MDSFDRAAPRGVGAVKVAGNYAADILPNMEAKSAGYPIGLYLDAKTNTYVEEFSTSNFFAIRHQTYVTPKSDAILPSVTNKSLMKIAEDIGMTVEQRPIHVDELLNGNFQEAAACGTAVVITPIRSVTYRNKIISLGNPEKDDSLEVGPVLKKLYTTVRSIQNGESEDKFNWMLKVDV